MLEARNLTKIYRPKKGAPVTALNNVNVQLGEKGMVFLLGKSGSGKSTLLNLIGGLDSISSGEIIIKGKSSAKFSQSDFDSYRNTFIGFIFQEFNILEDYTVGHNIGLSMELQHKKTDPVAIEALLEQVDLAGYGNRKPNELSGGQKQRVAIARALIKNPEIIMADEPTGALDSKTGKQVFDTLKKLSKEKLVIVVSHDRENAEIYGDRIIELADGIIINDRMRTSGGDFVELPINFVNDKLVHIKAGHQLTEDDVNRINALLKSSTADTFISLDEKSNLEFSKKVSVSGGSDGTFTATTPQNNPVKFYDPSNFKLVKSRLPYKDSFKMGASGLRLKKVRLAFTILLSFVAFTLFGFANTVSFFDPYFTELQTMHEEGHKMMTVSAQEGWYSAMGGTSWDSYNRQEKLGTEHLEKLEELTGSAVLRIFSDLNSGYRQDAINIASHVKDIQNNQYLYYFDNTTISDLIEVPNMTAGSLTLLAGKTIENLSYKEIALSDYMADFFVEYGYNEYNSIGEGVDIPNYQALIGKKLRTNFNFDLTIGGVYKTDIDVSKWEAHKKTTLRDASAFDRRMFSALSEMFLTMGYVKDGFTAEYNSGNVIESNKETVYTRLSSGDIYSEYRESDCYYLWNYSERYKQSDNIYWGEGNTAPSSLTKKEIVVDFSFFGIDSYNYETKKYDMQKVKDGFDHLVETNSPLLNATITVNGGYKEEDLRVKGIVIYDTENLPEEFYDQDKYPDIPQIILNPELVKELKTVFDAGSGGNYDYESAKLDNFGVGDFDYDKLIAGYNGSGEFIKYGTQGGYFNSRSNNVEIFWGDGKSARTLADNEIIISANQFDSRQWVNGSEVIKTYTNAQKKAMFNEMLENGTNNAKIGKLTDNYDEDTQSWKYSIVRGTEVKIVGIYLWDFQDTGAPIVGEELFARFIALANMPNRAVIKLTGNINQDRAIMNYLKSTVTVEQNSAFRVGTATLLTPILEMVEMFTGVLKTVFFWVSVVFSVFAGLLLMNFIGVSVAAKKKDIGILRAIGARSLDVFKIFLNEGMLIGLINIILSSVALVVLSVLLNKELGVSLLIPGVLQFALMALLCFGVVIIATYLPVRKIARKKPIDAINNK